MSDYKSMFEQSALERVIAEQQAEIDRLKRWRDMNDVQWQKQHKRNEALVAAAFEVLDSNGMPDPLMGLRNVLRKQGWCLTCECSPCECDGQYD